MRKYFIVLFIAFVMLTTNSYSTNENTPYLKTLRVNIEGIVPYFNREINEYYLNVNNSVTDLEFTLEPEIDGTSINVIGNKSLKPGLNEIKIELNLNGNKNKYYIYVTKTDNTNLANTNLETLAVENVFLTPEFSNNASYYKAEIENSKDALKVLAIPENISAKVEIEGNEKLQIGKNIIVIKVTAENGYSFRRYYLDIFRRNKIEEKKYEEKQMYQARKLSGVIHEDYDTDLDKVNSSNKKFDNNYIVITICAIFIIGICAFILIKAKNSD